MRGSRSQSVRLDYISTPQKVSRYVKSILAAESCGISYELNYTSIVYRTWAVTDWTNHIIWRNPYPVTLHGLDTKLGITLSHMRSSNERGPWVWRDYLYINTVAFNVHNHLWNSNFVTPNLKTYCGTITLVWILRVEGLRMKLWVLFKTMSLWELKQSHSSFLNVEIIIHHEWCPYVKKWLSSLSSYDEWAKLTLHTSIHDIG